MPVQDEVYISLNDVLEVRGSSLQQDEVWTLMCQTLHTVENIFARGVVHKNGVPVYCITPKTVQCTRIGGVIISSCLLSSLKETNNWLLSFRDFSVGKILSDNVFEKVYIYMLGQTMKYALCYSDDKRSQEVILKNSSILQSILEEMTNKDDFRLSLSELSKLCHEYVQRGASDVSCSPLITKIYEEVLGSLPEQTNFNCQNQNSTLNQNNISTCALDSLSSSSLFSNFDNNHVCGCIMGKKFVICCCNKSFAGPRERWKNAFVKIREKKKMQRQSDACRRLSTFSQRTSGNNVDDANAMICQDFSGSQKQLVSPHEILCNSERSNQRNSFTSNSATDPSTMFYDPYQMLKNKEFSILDQYLCDGSFVNENDSCLRKTVLESNFGKAIYLGNASTGNSFNEEISVPKVSGPKSIMKSQKPIIFLHLESKQNPSIKLCSLTVILLNSQRLNVTCDANLTGRELFNLIIEHLNLQESHMYGLAVNRDGEYLFVDGQQRVCKLLSSLYPTLSRKCEEGTTVLTLYLRIKFYLFDVSLLRCDYTVNTFYAQLRKDILEGRIRTCVDVALLLGGLALQTEFGHHQLEMFDYLNIDDYFPEHVIKHLGTENAIHNLWMQQGVNENLPAEDAKLIFLQKVCELPEYGYQFHRVQHDVCNEKTEWLGIGFSGLGLFEEIESQRFLSQSFPWHKIQKITFTRDYLCLCLKSSVREEKIVQHLFHTSESVKSRSLYHMAVSHHQFINKMLSGFTSQECEKDTYSDSGPSSLGSQSSYQDFEKEYNLNSFSEESLSLSSFSHDLKNRELTQGTSNGNLLSNQVTNFILSREEKQVQNSLNSCQSLPLEENELPSERINATHMFQESEITCVLEKALDVGLGLILTCSKDSIEGTYIEAIVEGTPAYQILQPGDHIVNLNGECVEKYNFLETADIIHKIPALSKISLTVKRIVREENLAVYADDKNLPENGNEAVERLSNEQVIEESCNDDKLLCRSLSVNELVDKRSCAPVEETNSLDPPVPKPRKKSAARGKIREEKDVNFLRERKETLPHMHASQSENVKISELDNAPDYPDKKTIDRQMNFSDCLPSDLSVSSDLPDCDESEMCKLKEMEDSVFSVTLKKINGSLGFRITREENHCGEEMKESVYVHSLIPGGAAAFNGSINPGDRLLEVNGEPVEEHSYPEVVSLLKECPPVTRLVFQRCQQSTTLPSMIAKWGKKSNRSSADASSIQRKNNSNSARFQDSVDYPSLITDGECHVGSLKRTFSGHKNDSNLQRKADYWAVVDVTSIAHKEGLKSPALNEISADSSFAKSVYSDECCNEANVNFFSSQDLNSDSTGSREGRYSDGLNAPENFTDVFALPEKKTFYGTLQDDDGLQAKKYQLDSPDESGIESDTHSAKVTDCQDDNYCARHILPNVIVTPVPKQQKKAQLLKDPEDVYKILNSNNTFEVPLRKSTRGLGISIFGGSDSQFPDAVCQLIRICKLYPLQPAADSGQLQVGDVILEVNGLQMLGLTHIEALETLRVAPTDITLKIFRPSSSNFPPVSDFVKDLSPSGSVFLVSPTNSASNSLTRPNNLSFSPPVFHGEFEVTLNKVDGGLGFSVLYHKETCQAHSNLYSSGIYIKALIRDPAKSDGRLQPGDRLLKVNGVDVSGMSHAEAVTFLRSAPSFVTLQLYRSADGLSPLSIDDKPLLPKPLRQEAKEIVNAQKQNKGSPRRLRDRRKRRTDSRESGSSASGSDCSSFSPPPSTTPSKRTDLAKDTMGSASDLQEMVGLNRNLRPKSLDVLSVNERKQSFGRQDRTNDEDNTFHRQASVLGTCNEMSSSKAISGKGAVSQLDGQGLLKWRGFTLQTNKSGGQAGDEVTAQVEDVSILDAPPVPPRRMESLANTPVHSPTSPFPQSKIGLSPPGNKMNKVYVELDRGWHGRLGFSLRDLLPEEELTCTVRSPIVKAVYHGSLAFNDGRVKEGDRIIEVNGESMCNLPAIYAIDVLRKTRGKIGILLYRFENSSGTNNIVTSQTAVLPS